MLFRSSQPDRSDPNYPVLDSGGAPPEEFRILPKGLEYAISVFVAAAPAAGFALLRELVVIDDGDVHSIVRSNLGKSGLSLPTLICGHSARVLVRHHDYRSPIGDYLGH